ncbi:hypothetical protein GCM10011357_07740 [Lacimicrobium alkaliphilum]|uniref:FAD dependent oxidoreductase domain-containing protein n=1 Tax=Lacimicrobium alkaliphilum TaxID=1526571 RepID=A0ABQ1R1Y5_9ALTE|nr:hypothetical protein GCM10011357_07740 [Lacimicrobium alkaliphilum]
MDLKSGYLYWAVKNGLMYAFPQPDADLSCDLVVAGAGISGALIAWSITRPRLCSVKSSDYDVRDDTSEFMPGLVNLNLCGDG